LVPLTASQRAVLLTNAAPLDRELVKARLAYWDKIPPEQQKLLLESKAALEYLAGIRRGGGASSSTSSPDMAEDLGRFRNLSPGERVKVMEQFKQLFELEDNERATVLHRRSGPKREQLERALIQLRQIPPEKQAAYVDAVSRFTVMTEAEQAQFLKSAERWKQLSTEERAAWQALFIQSPALLEPPPLPPGFDPYAPPPLPPTLAPNKTPMQATNRPPRNNIGA
jgi:hypothetical protein